MKVAVNDIVVDGATMECVWAPPSDHESNQYAEPFTVSGEPALIVFVDPTITVFVNGVGTDPSPASSRRPDGLAVKLSATVFGCRKTLAVPVNPSESRAVSWSSRKEG